MSQKTTSFSSASDACFLSSLAEGEADLRDLRSGLGVLSSEESRLLLDPEPEPEDDSESERALNLREEASDGGGDLEPDLDLLPSPPSSS